MLEKQKARFTYGLNERQFSKYVRESVAKKGVNSIELLFQKLEYRLDNVVYRLGFAPTRSAARQMVSHGHIKVGARRVTIPSYEVSVGEVISIRPGSAGKPLFATLVEKMKEVKVPAWLSYDAEKKEAKVVGAPKYEPRDNHFDIKAVLEFYSR